MSDQSIPSTNPNMNPDKYTSFRLSRLFNLDLLIIVFFAIFALLFFLGRWGGLRPVLLVDRSGDAGTLLSFAATLDSPQNFAGDQMLDPMKQAFSYNGIYLPYIRFVGRVVGDYGLALLILLPLCIFLQLTSFYILGKELFKNRIWAVLLTAVTAIPIQYGFWDSWGLSYDPLARFLFQSILPIILLAFLKWRSSPRRWPWLMILISLMFFIHVISAPGIAFMLWVGFFLYIPKAWKLSKKLLFQLLNGLAFVIPFAIFTILSKSSSGFTTATSGATLPEIMQYLNRTFDGFLNLWASVLVFIKILDIYFLLIPAVVAVIVIYLTKFQDELKTNLVLFWLGAILFVSLVIPAVEHAIEKSLGIPPIQVDLVRNLRYSIPLIEIIGISGFVAIVRRFRYSFATKTIGTILVALVYLGGCLWFVFSSTRDSKWDHELGLDFVAREIMCISHGKLFCPTSQQLDEANALFFIKSNTPIDASFLSIPTDDLAYEIRYAGMRAVTFTRLDKVRIAYMDLRKTLEIEKTEKIWNQKKLLSGVDFTRWAFNLSCETRADYWLVTKIDSPMIDITQIGGIVVFENETYSVISLPECLR